MLHRPPAHAPLVAPKPPPGSVSTRSKLPPPPATQTYFASPAHLAAQFGLHISSIYNIISGRCWGGIHVAGWHPDNRPGRSRKLTAAQVADMRRQYRTGNVTFNNLAARYQVSVATARRAVKRINYRWA